MPSEETLEHLRYFCSWNFDIFRLTVLCAGSPMVALGLRLFEAHGLFQTCPIHVDQVARFFYHIERRYATIDMVPYHNNQHGTDVMHSVHVMLSTLVASFTPLEVLSCLIAGAGHDVEHFGRTNVYLIKKRHNLAMLYNDRSVLENHHARVTFDVMFNEPECNLIAGFRPDEQKDIRKLVVDMIMATDMVKHARILEELVRFVDKLTNGVRSSRICFSPLFFAHLDALAHCMVHMADLGSATKEWRLCKEWTDRLMEEFFDEGDAERADGLPVGALNDRFKVDTPKAQIGFITYVCQPLWHQWNRLVNRNADTV
ncbi:uncharacterized protein MONBRDRAFT_13650, partial [Monosiga brevicollis MX1]